MNDFRQLAAAHLDRLWRQAGRPGPQRLTPWLAAGALAGAALAWPVGNPVLLLVLTWAGAWLPVDYLRWQARRRQARLDRAAAELLPAVAGLVRSLRHPLPALAELAPRAPGELRRPLGQALAACGGGVPLPEALTRMAADLGNPFYLHQMAALVGLHLQQGGDLAASLERLSHRLHARLELQAEAAVEVQGYRYLILVLAGFTFLPVLFWALTGSPQWEALRTGTGGWLLTWAVVSTLLVHRLPRWLGRDL
jgi:Flp pilus assembly protein TadB